MKKFSPGASINSDYAYACDNCGDWGVPVVIWDGLSDQRDHFAICHKCLGDMYLEHVSKIDKTDESIIVKRRSVSEKVRTDIFNRDGNKCLKCGSQENLTLDHIIPFSKGGKTIKKNLQTLCAQCNSKKGAKIEFAVG